MRAALCLIFVRSERREKYLFALRLLAKKRRETYFACLLATLQCLYESQPGSCLSSIRMKRSAPFKSETRPTRFFFGRTVRAYIEKESIRLWIGRYDVALSVVTVVQGFLRPIKFACLSALSLSSCRRIPLTSLPRSARKVRYAAYYDKSPEKTPASLYTNAATEILKGRGEGKCVPTIS